MVHSTWESFFNSTQSKLLEQFSDEKLSIGHESGILGKVLTSVLRSRLSLMMLQSILCSIAAQSEEPLELLFLLVLHLRIPQVEFDEREPSLQFLSTACLWYVGGGWQIHALRTEASATGQPHEKIPQRRKHVHVPSYQASAQGT